MISVCVVGAKTSGNLGAIARVMANFGLSKLFLVSPQCDVVNDESKARAMRAVKILENAKIVHSLNDIDADYLIATSAKLSKGNNLHRIYITPEELEFADNIHSCIVLGREDIGLLNDEIKQCDILVHIPTDPDYKTMNISHALAIILYAIYRKNSSGPRSKLASRKEIEELFKTVSGLASKVEDGERYLEVFRSVINRTFLKKKEANALIGLFKKIGKE